MSNKNIVRSRKRNATVDFNLGSKIQNLKSKTPSPGGSRETP